MACPAFGEGSSHDQDGQWQADCDGKSERDHCRREPLMVDGCASGMPIQRPASMKIHMGGVEGVRDTAPGSSHDLSVSAMDRSNRAVDGLVVG